MSRIKRLLVSFFVLLLSLIIVFSDAPKANAAAGIYEAINFQGKVANLNGTNVSNGSYDMVFRLYKASSGGVAQWTETWNAANQVTVTDGVFQVALGSITSISSLDWNDDAWYLSVEFNGDGEMDPRIRITSVPYALNAKSVAGLTVQDSAGGADTTGTLQVADGATLTFSAGFVTSGDDAITLTTTAATNVTLPTTGTLATLAGSEIFTNKTIGTTGLTFSGAGTDITTATNEDFTVTAAGTGDVVVSTDADTQFRIVASAAPGVDIADITNAGQGTVTTDVDGLSIAFTQGNDADATDTNAGLHIVITNSSDDADTLYGIQIDGITGGTPSETAFYIGAGWDTGIDLNANTLVNIGNAGTDFTSTGGLTLAEILTVNDDVDINLSTGEEVDITASAPTVDMLDISGSSTVTDGVSAIDVAFTAATDAGSDTNAGIHVTVTGSGEAGDTMSGLKITTAGIAAGTLQGVTIDGITGGSGTETALSIGAGWDTGIDLNANTLVNIGNSGTDFDTSGGLTLAGDLAVNGDDITSDGASLKIQVGASGASTIAVVQIGAGGAGSTTPDFLGLDVKSDTGDPAGGAEGYMYYNTSDNVFRCYQNTGWTNCIGSGASPSLQNAYDNGTPTILTDGSGDVIIQLIGGATDTQFEINAASAPEIDMVNITNAGFGSNTNGVDGLSINFTQAGGTATNAAAHLTITGSGNVNDTINGLQITATGATNNAQNGIFISSITGGSGDETALNIGAGWDTGINLNSNILVNIGSADTDFTVTGGLTVGGDVLTVNDDVDINLAAGENVTILDIGNASADMLFISSNGQSVTADNVDGMHLVFTQGNDGDATDDNAGIHLDFNSNSTLGDNLYGLWVGNLTAGSANEYALYVGTGWDRGLTVLDSNTTSVYLASTDGDAASGITFGSATPVQMYRSAAGELTITDGAGNSFVFDTVNGPAYAGTARPSKTITLSPEYDGASFSTFYGAGTDTNTTVTVTSDTVSTANAFRNYYQVTRTAGTLHYYTIALKVKLPKDFAAWETSNAIVLNYATNSTSSADNLLNVWIYKVDETTSAVVGPLTLVSGVAQTWTTNAIDDSTLDDGDPDWDAADEEVIIFLRMGSQSSNWTRVGDITLNYKAAF